MRGTGGTGIGVAIGLSILGSFGCSESGAGKAWSSLSICVLGKSVQASPAERQKALRLLQLSNPSSDGKPDAWPGRCSTYANQLYTALENSGNQAPLKRTMKSKLGCADGKQTCVLNSETLTLFNGELSEAAKSAELKLEAVPGIKEPESTVQISITAAEWQPLQKQPAQVVGPNVLADGRVVWLLKSTGERMRPIGCVYTPSSRQIDCAPANDKVPALPPQSIQLVADDKELVAAGLTEKGLMAFDLKTGESVLAKGMAGNLLRDGLAVERGEGDKGFVGIPIVKNKASKPIELKSKGTIEQPFSLGNQVVWLEQGEGKARLVAKELKRGKVADVATFEGTFAGPFHVCKAAGMTAVATWSGHTGQRGAKPNLGSDMTAVTVSILSDGGWSKPVEAKLPYRRAIESDLICSGSTASVAWAEPVETGVKVGKLSCDKSGCKNAEAILANVDARWWWSVGPVGDKMLLMWRAGFGEARMRLAALEQLDQAKDIVLFDDQDHGGPKAGEATSVFTGDSALLLFKQEPPVALSVAADASVKILGGNPAAAKEPAKPGIAGR